MKKSFLTQLKNRYQVLVELDDHTNNNADEINSLWNIVKKSYQETSKEIMGHREKKHEEWISQEAWQKIKERRNIKQKLLGIKSERLKEQQKQVYKAADRTVKQLTRRVKRKYLEDMATQAEEAAHKETRRRCTISQNRFVDNLDRTWTPQSKTKMGNY